VISFEDAQAQVLAHVTFLEDERIPILNGLGRVLACGITAPRDVPHEDNSAMDGFAVRQVTSKVRLAETVHSSPLWVNRGQEGHLREASVRVKLLGS
jgi:molybdopterin biosynthesis enzyme